MLNSYEKVNFVHHPEVYNSTVLLIRHGALLELKTIRRLVLRVVVTVVLIVAAASLRLWPLQGLGMRLAYLTFYPAVMIAALYGGLSTGLLATLLSGLVIYFWQPTGQPFIKDSADWMGMAVFIINGVMIASVCEGMYRARARAAMEAQFARQEKERAEAANRQTQQAMQVVQLRETELAQANERLNQLDKAKTEFFSNVSHEFRTPLTLMLGPIEDILNQPAAIAPESRAALETAYRNALRLLKLVNMLLVFTRIEAGRAQLAKVPTDLAELTAELASNFESVCASAGLELIVDCPPLPRPVHVDRSMWEKIVLNLISNAFKFTFEGRIEVRLHARNDSAELSVSDTGVGIPADALPHLFERFYRIAGARGRSYEGSGIGLALVDELVKLHEGSTRVESQEGQGSTFTVSMPFGMSSEVAVSMQDHAVASSGVTTEMHARSYVEEALHWLPAAEQQAAIETAGIPVVSGLHGRIVIADDNSDMRGYIARLLETAGFEVHACADGQAALSACRSDAPDLVLTDVMMPGMNGFELLKQLRAAEQTALMPVVLVSARAGEEARIEGLAAGADDYIVKPFNARELVARVNGAIALARSRREASERINEANMALSREVAEHKLAEEKLSRYMADLERSNRELDEFAYIASHDLKEPLRGINNYASFLIEDYADKLDKEGRSFLERMQRLVERETSLIDRLLAYSRIGSTELELELADVDNILDNVAEDLKPFLSSQQVELRRASQLPVLACNPLRVGEVLQNLIVNGAKYNESSEKWVEVGCCDQGGTPVFYVRDNGIGIAPQHRDSVFRIFKRLHEQNKYGGGTGAGLTIVKKIVERHGGRIWLESAPGEGTTFYFTLTGII